MAVNGMTVNPAGLAVFIERNLSMWLWISTNWLALYGAIVGTFALFISVMRLRHAVKQSRVSLTLTATKVPEYDKNIEEMHATEDKPNYDRRSLFKLYEVTVRNTGNIDAHIESVGILKDRYNRETALKSQNQDPNILLRVSDLSEEFIPPKSSKSYDVYLKRGEEPFVAKKGFVQDKTGQTWFCKVR